MLDTQLPGIYSVCALMRVHRAYRVASHSSKHVGVLLGVEGNTPDRPAMILLDDVGFHPGATL